MDNGLAVHDFEESLIVQATSSSNYKFANGFKTRPGQ